MTLNLAHFPQVTQPNLLYVSFNQTFECFAVGLSNGFRIYNCNPFGESGRKEFHGGIGIVEMLFRSNILALVGDGRDAHFPTSQVVLWDDRRNQPLAEVAFRHPVRAVKLQRQKLVVALDTDVFLYDLEDLQAPTKFATIRNFRGILSVSPSPDNAFLVCPGEDKGLLRVQRMDAPHRHIIHANDSGIACVGLSHDGKYVGVASEKGTLIRIFLVDTGAKLAELRRGTTPAEIHSIAFSADLRFVLCTSDRGTLHVWCLPISVQQGAPGAAEAHNKKSVLSVLTPVSGYFGSEWSTAKWCGPEVPTIAGFSPTDDSIYVICADSTFFHIGIQETKGELHLPLRRGPCMI